MASGNDDTHADLSIQPNPQPRTWFCSLKVQHTIGTFLFCLNQQNAQKEIPPCFSTNWVPHWEKSAPLTAVNLTKFNLIRRLIRPFLISAWFHFRTLLFFPINGRSDLRETKVCADGHTKRNRAAKLAEVNQSHHDTCPPLPNFLMDVPAPQFSHSLPRCTLTAP